MGLLRQECETSEYFMSSRGGSNTCGHIQLVCQKSSHLTEKGLLRGRRPKQGPLHLHMRGGTTPDAYKSLSAYKFLAYTIKFRQLSCRIAALSEFIFLGLKPNSEISSIIIRNTLFT